MEILIAIVLSVMAVTLYILIPGEPVRKHHSKPHQPGEMYELIKNYQKKNKTHETN